MAPLETETGTEICGKDRQTDRPVVFSHGWPLVAFLEA